MCVSGYSWYSMYFKLHAIALCSPPEYASLFRSNLRNVHQSSLARFALGASALCTRVTYLPASPQILSWNLASFRINIYPVCTVLEACICIYRSHSTRLQYRCTHSPDPYALHVFCPGASSFVPSNV